MGRLGAVLLVTVLLSTVVSAEPERPCPACNHGMARAEGQEAGAADYLCRFCEVALHVRADGREAVSYRVEGERREFELVDGARLSFPLPGAKSPEDVIIPVPEAALAAAPGAGHPVKLPGHPVGLPGHPVSLPAAPVKLPDHPVRLPEHPVKLPSHPVELPSHPVELSSHPVRLPAHPVTLPSHPVQRSGAPVRLPGHPVRLPGHPTGIGGSLVTAPTVAQEASAPRSVTVVFAPAGQSRFFGRPPMPSVLR